MREQPAFDLLDADAYLTQDPDSWFAWLRRNSPVYRHPEPGGPGFWVISRHEDVKYVNRHPALFSSDDAYGGPTGLTRSDRQRMLDAAHGAKSLPHMDPPEHTRHRRVYAPHFLGRTVAKIEDRVRAMAVRLLDDALAQRDVDFVHDVAAKFPTQVISEMMGVPEGDRAYLFNLATANFGAMDPEYMANPAQYKAARAELADYARTLADRRRLEPTDDVMNTLAHARVTDEELQDQYVGLMFDLFLAAGHETVMTTLSRGVQAFLEHPEQLEELAGDVTQLVDSATEELLRWATPVRYFRRAALQDIEMHGQQIRAGESVSIWYTSANRDEEEFDEPARFDVRRDPNDHVAFGGGGPHFCIGAHLSRLEIRVFLEELVGRNLHIEALAPAQQLRSVHFDALKHLPVRITRSRGTGWTQE